MTRKNLYSARRLLVVISAVSSLTSCGGGGGGGGVTPSVSSDCNKYSVTTGFAKENLNSVYEGGGGGGTDGADGGSAGAGGGLGKVLGGIVSVTRIADGRLIGEAKTDAQTGLVTIHTCGKPEPLLITLKGTVDARYFDEGEGSDKGEFVPFGPDQELHSLVDKLDENVGVSAFTEAAYRYALNNYLADPAKIINQSVALRKTGNVTGLPVERIVEANQQVLKELNRILPENYRLTSLKALPTPIDQNSTDQAIPENGYGKAAVVTGAFAWMAGKFHLGAQQPALLATEEFARDLTDGRLDGFALDGTPASQIPTYDSVNIPIMLTVGTNKMAQTFGTTTFANAPPKVDFAGVQYDWRCKQETIQDQASLLKNGIVSVTRFTIPKDCYGRNESAEIPAFATDIKQLTAGPYTGAAYMVNTKGEVLGWGNPVCGQLGNGQSAGENILTPTRIENIFNITSLAAGYYFTIARDNNGNVYSWGSDYAHALGLGKTLSETCITPDSTVPDAVSTRPMQVPGLSNIVNVYAFGSRAIAVDRGGRVYEWGSACGYMNGGPATPKQKTDFPAGTKIISIATRSVGCFGLTNDGTLIGWGIDTGLWFGDGTPTEKILPTKLKALTDIREIASDRDAFYALDKNGRVWGWGGGEDQFVNGVLVETPVPIPTPIQLRLPQNELVRHIVSNFDGVHLFTVDGKIYTAAAGKNFTLTLQ